MTSNSLCKKFTAVCLSGILTVCVSACASPHTSQSRPGVGLPETATKLIGEKYAFAPDVQRAAEGFANNLVRQWRAAVATGTYDDTLAREAGNSQMCWTARMERTLNRPVTETEILEFVGALTATRELFSASQASDHQQSGHPLIISSSEAAACSKAAIE